VDNNSSELITELLFWLSIFYLFYSAFGYLIFLRFLAWFHQRPVQKTDIAPSVTLLIAAYNEESVIAAKIENCLSLDYSPDKLQIIVVSDASEDRTNDIVLSYTDRGIVLHDVPDGEGKVNALNKAIDLASGEILVISDADSTYQCDALLKLVRNFGDPTVGAVTGEEIRVQTQDDKGVGESIYVRLDNHIKRLEGMTGSMVMVNGGFFAIRRDLYPILPPHLIHDAVVPCRLQLQGFRTAYEPEAVSIEKYALETSGDFRRRLRTIIQAFYSYLSEPEALNPLRTGFFAIKVLSHRFTRWFVLPWLGVALLSNLLLVGFPFYRGSLIVQFVCYLFAVIGYLLDRRGIRLKPFYIPFYYVYIHTAAFLAILKGTFGERIATWKPTQRAVEGMTEQ
jgi:cellulose synthase/poly-beta-1,6-N-acetylglucosamine synthase-like glycosyltransferase